MLKVLINEEEVLTNKDFTIKKEMLNTPSVILNNVYPKTWEDEKDYTSNFYHPQDYSKCKIIDETIVPADPGETITGTSFTILDNDNTKLNELTELEGNTSQSGTPTPSSPQPINVVSGRQEVDVLGKNLFDYSTNIIENANLSVGTAMKITGDNACKLSYIKCQPNTTYTISRRSPMANRFFIATTQNYPRVQEPLLSAEAIYNDTTTSYTLTTPSNANYIVVRFINNQIDNYETYAKTIQIEKGSTASEYEAYTGQSYEINLGKNLFDKSTAPVLNMFIGSTTINNNSSTRLTYIPIQPNTTYTISKVLSSRFIVATTTVIPSNGLAFTTSVGGNNETELTITSGANDQYLSVFFYHSSYDTLTPEEILDTLQIERGSQATSYSPYKTPIELCKIGNYKDRIYKENGTWYLHKEIGKFNLTGTENWSRQTMTVSTNYIYFYTTAYDNLLTWNLYGGYCNYLDKFTGGANPYITRGATISTSCFSTCASSSTDTAKMRVAIDSSVASSPTAFKNWLSTNTPTIYYQLATPTTTEITDSELISQLNAIELLEGLNNVSVSSADLPGEITIHYNYTEEQTIDDLLFCGVVKNSGNISLNPRQPHFQSLQILDFKTFLSEGELDSFVIYQKTILEAIQMVIANIQDYGFILGNVNILNPTDIIGAYSTKDKTAYDVFNYIADITQSRWTTRLIDENHVAIDFYDPTLMIEGTPINYTQTFFENNLIDDMTYSYGSNNYRNKQVMTSSQVYSNISQQQSIVANGYQTQFPTEQPIGKINSITSNGIPLTFATFNEKGMGYVADFYYSPGDNYFESEDLRSTGEILIIDYVAIIEGRQIITNPLEIDRISDSTGRKGIISRYEQRNDATTSTELQKIGESYIKYKGTPEIKLKISTRKNIWEVGQRVQFNAPIEELDTEYMIRTKKINYISTIDTIFYEYELISSFNSETEINYFDNQRAKASGNIGEGEYISRNIDIESTANIIFYDTETTEVQVDGDNVLNSILNSPFTS